MSPSSAIDLQALDWIAAEVTQALARARALLSDNQKRFDTALLREAQTQLFAARSAVEVAGIAPLPRLLTLFEQAIDQLLAATVPDPTALAFVTEALIAVENLWYELVHHRQWQPLRLRPYYEKLAQLARERGAHPADLFLIPYPPAAGTPNLTGEAADAARRRLRHRFTQALAQWLNSGKAAALLPAREALVGRLLVDSGTPQEPLWIAALGFLEGVIRKQFPWNDAQRNLLITVQRAMRAPLPSAAQTALFRQLVLPVAETLPQTRVQRLMHRYWRLRDSIAQADQPLPVQPLLELDRNLSSAAAHARSCWEKAENPWTECREVVLLVARALFARQDRASEQLANQLETFAQMLPEAVNDAAALLLATTLLTLESSARTGQITAATLTSLAESWAQTLAGHAHLPHSVADHSDVGGDAALAAEITGLCAEIEQQLDQYWRNPDTPFPLAALKKRLDQLAAIAVITNHFEIVPEIEEARRWLQAIAEGNTPLTAKDPQIAQIATWASRLTVPVHPTASEQSTTPAAIPWHELFPAHAPAAGPTTAASAASTELHATVPAAEQSGSETSPAATTDTAPASASAVQEEVDESAELRAIFLAECDEILTAMGQAQAQLARYPDDREALTNWRRQVHTLKGSSRIVGLTQLGESAWQVEQTLNHWLRDPSFVPDSAALAFLTQCHAAFQEAVHAIAASGIDLPEPISAIVAAARFWRGEEATPPPASELAPCSRQEEIEPSSPAASASATASYPSAAAAERAFDLVHAERKAIEEAQPPSAAEFAPAPLPEFLPTIDFAIEAAATSAATAPAPTTLPERVVFGNRQVSRLLFEAFRTEAREHLASFARYLHNPPASPSEVEIRALHTLAGICGTVQIPEMHELAHAVENVLKALQTRHDCPSAALWALLHTAHEALFADLITVENGQIPPMRHDLIAHLAEAELLPSAPEARDETSAASLPAAEATPAEATPEPEAEVVAPAALPTPAPAPTPEAITEPDQSVPPTATATSAPLFSSPAGETGAQDLLDPDLKDIFAVEGEELFARLDAALESLPKAIDPVNEAHLEPIQRLLHTLKGSARMAGALALGERIHRLEEQLKAADPATVAALSEEIAAARAHFRMLLSGTAPCAVPPSETAATAASALVSTETVAQQEQLAADFEPLATTTTTAMTLRLSAALIDRWTNELGELGIQRARAENALIQLRQAATDLTDNIIRLRQHLRELEIQAEAQLQARIQVAETQHTEFDPLEMDRYTRLQELTRILAEGIADVATLQQTILQAADQAEVSLHRQGRQTRDLQAEWTALRSVPVATVRDRFERLVMQTAEALGKEARLVLIGEQTHIDRAVLERLIPALEHLLRNAVAHGIETPAEREALGKPRMGTVTLTVRAGSGESQWLLTDDGRGLDYARILAKARERGWVAPDQTPSEAELAQMIFRSGFSTAEQVTQIAGRGVGMDVVQAEVAAMGGRIDVSSTPGEGTRFLVRIPTELTLVPLLIVSEAGKLWAIPTETIVSTTQLKAELLNEKCRAGVIEHQGINYPLTSFAALIGAPEPPRAARHWVLFCQNGEDRLAIWLEGIVGRQELLAKPSGPLLRRIPGMLGAVLLADGTIALIVQPLLLRQNVASSASPRLAVVSGQTEEAEGALPSARELVSPLIMVVDDSLTVRRLTQRLLERHGYRAVVAKDGQEALDLVHENVPDLILSDIEMPRMDGFELLRQLRARPQTRQTPVIMITSRLAEKHRQHALDLGANEYLGKPYQEEALLALLARYLPAAAA